MTRIFSPWDREFTENYGKFAADARTKYMDAEQALHHVEYHLQKIEQFWEKQYHIHLEVINKCYPNVDAEWKEAYLSSVIHKPCEMEISSQKNAVDSAGEAADAAWEELQRYKVAAQPMRDGSDLLAQLEVARFEVKQAMDEVNNADERLSQAINQCSYFERGRYGLLMEENRYAGEALRFAEQQAQQAQQNYDHANVICERELAKFNQTRGAVAGLPAPDLLAQQRLEAFRMELDMACNGVDKAAEFLRSRPEYVERVGEELRAKLPIAISAVNAANARLTEKELLLNKLSVQACPDHKHLPPIFEEQDLSAVKLAGQPSSETTESAPDF